MRIFIVNSDERRTVEQQLQEAKNWIERTDLATISPDDEPPGPPYGIVITGQSLVGFYMLTYCGPYCLCVCVQRHALKPEMEMLLLETASQCKAVICCRVTPLQKVRERERKE